jgi:AraC-like DNA-binding protein
VDLLADVLAVTGVRGAVAATVVAGDSWGLSLDAVPGAAFHAVTAGNAWLRVPGKSPVQLVPGDAVLLPGGVAHVLAGNRSGPTVPFDHAAAADALEQGLDLRVGTGPTTTRILCASYHQDDAAKIATLAALPDVVQLPAHTATPGLRATLSLLAGELAEPQTGTRLVLEHIVNILLVQIVRAWLADAHSADVGPSWLRGLGDAATLRVLVAMHEHPARAWTARELADTAGISVSTLARRFASLVGMTPTEYLRRWRLDLAAHRLRTTDRPVAAVARSVGYTSEFAFTRAFARHRGQPPVRYRSRGGAVNLPTHTVERLHT